MAIINSFTSNGVTYPQCLGGSGNTFSSGTDVVAVECTNPVEYGYQLLEASGEFPDATWNV